MTTYKESGVDVALADEMLRSVLPDIKRTHNKNVLSIDNAFASLMRIPPGFQNPVMSAATDGVGSKLTLGLELGMIDNIGTDLVAMCVNDLITNGSNPMFFLDYYATGKLDPVVAKKIIQSIARACSVCNMALIGGETAELPRTYKEGDLDLAGFAVGLVEEDVIQSPDNVDPGNLIIGVQSSGFHSNGYSLIYKILEENYPADPTVLEKLMEPTRLYVGMMEQLTGAFKSAANITGGGLISNISRALPSERRFSVDLFSWDMPEPFKAFEPYHDIAVEEQLQVWNCGIGYVLIVDEDDADEVLEMIEYPAWIIGEVI